MVLLRHIRLHQHLRSTSALALAPDRSIGRPCRSTAALRPAAALAPRAPSGVPPVIVHQLVTLFFLAGTRPRSGTPTLGPRPRRS